MTDISLNRPDAVAIEAESRGMRYKPKKIIDPLDGREFWIVIDTKTGTRVFEHRKKHAAYVDSATRNKRVTP